MISMANILILIFVLSIASCRKDSSPKSSVLEEDKGFLQIPGVGWQTFDRTADLDNTLRTLKFKSGCAYYRWYWVSLEPQEGQYNFEMIDDILKTCRENNQALAFRVMCEDPWGEGLPQWLIDKGIKRTYTPCAEEGAHYAPDMSDPVFINYH
jgi:GH35 family endo-1,4-beta-xylanase